MERDLSKLPFTGPWLLAPMEGVTEPCYRGLVLALHEDAPESGLGGAYTEFVRVVDRVLPERLLRRHLGTRRSSIPVGLQLMGSDLGALAETARVARDAGAALIDLNFGCPAKGALRGCAGSALLRDPRQLEAVVEAVASALDGSLVTAKIRAGYDDAELLEDLARAAEAGGAALLTVHCRTRAEGYQEQVDWARIARAVEAVEIPVCGNGGVRRHADLERMRLETGCALVMVGQGALADPWIFGGREVDAASAAGFLLDYAAAMQAQGGFPLRRVGARIKQLLRHWTAGDLVGTNRDDWLREDSAEGLLRRLQLLRGAEPCAVVLD